VPAATLVVAQLPLCGSHEAAWHGLVGAVHVLAVPPVQSPEELQVWPDMHLFDDWHGPLSTRP
jgi:hypothetical protein